MSGSEIDALASALFDTMLEDVVLGIALEEHKAGMRNRAVCAVCHTRCRLEEHINGGASSGLPGTPVSGTAGTGGGGSGNANGTTNGAKSEPIVLLDCLKCKRQVTPNRYAAHLATCLGLGNARRAGPRNAAGKARHYRPGTESGATTPIQRPGSLNGEDTTTATPAAKSKPSKKKKKPDAVEPTNGNNKREGAAPAKTTKTKKQKVGKAANGKPLAFQPSELDGFATVSVASPSPSKPSSTLSRVPSKLQNSQTPASPSGSNVTTPSHTPQMPPATIPAGVPAPPRVVRGTGPPRPLLGRGPSVPRTAPVVLEKPPPPPTRQSSGRTEVDGDLDDLVDTASDSSDDS